MYQVRNFDYLFGLKGFSEQLLKNHFTLYQGYVNNTNKLLEKINLFLKDNKIQEPEFAELRRRFGWEFNGMRLHEYYFENLGNKTEKINKKSELFKQIEKDFGSYENWETDFKALGAIRGIGWIILYYDPSHQKLINVWINEHDVGHLASLRIILVMDVFEHAYLTDYGLKKINYIESFFNNLNWEIIEKRFRS